MVGTPPAPVMRSRSISCIAISGSHLRINTSLPPMASIGTIVAWHPVTWNSGTTSRLDFGGAFGSGTGIGSPRRRKLRACKYGLMGTDVQVLRWEPTAPFGLPVVPDV